MILSIFTAQTGTAIYDFLKSNHLIVLPVFIVILGWILSSINYFVKDRKQKSRRLRKSIYKLEDIRINMFSHIRSAAESKLDYDDLNVYEGVRRRSILDRYQDDQSLVRYFAEITNDIAEYYPIISLEIDSILKHYLTFKRLKLKETAKSSKFDTMYVRMIFPLERQYLISFLKLEKEILKLCKKISYRLYLIERKRMNFPLLSVWLQALFEMGVIKWKVSKLGYFIEENDSSSSTRSKSFLKRMQAKIMSIRYSRQLSDEKVKLILKVIDLDTKVKRNKNPE